MPWITLAMAGASAIQQQQKQDQQRRQAAIDTRFSPWTGIKPGAIDTNGALGGAIQGGAAGMAQSQNMENSDAWKQWLNKSQQNGQNTMPVDNSVYASRGAPYAQSAGPWAFGNKFTG